mgnify:CR=1 FL=1
MLMGVSAANPWDRARWDRAYQSERVPVKAQYYCAECRRPTLFEKDSVNHVLHLLIAIFCCFPWVAVWALLLVHNVFLVAPLCPRCGHRGPTNVGAFLALTVVIVILTLAALVAIGALAAAFLANA